MKNFKKIISMLLIFSLLLLLSACGTCNKSNEKDQQNTHTPEDTVEITEAELTDAENGTDKPMEKPTEKATESQSTDIVIDGIKFDEDLKHRLNNAETYGEVCEILGKEGTLIEAPNLVTQWAFNLYQSSSYQLYMKFKRTDNGVVLAEDMMLTTEECLGKIPSKVTEDMKSFLVAGKTLQEIKDFTNVQYPQPWYGNVYKYEWRFSDDIRIEVHVQNATILEEENFDSVSVCYIELWDSNIESQSEYDRIYSKLEVGQSYKEICDIIGKEGSIGNLVCRWELDDGTQLVLRYYLKQGNDPKEITLFNGICRKNKN